MFGVLGLRFDFLGYWACGFSILVWASNKGIWAEGLLLGMVWVERVIGLEY